MGSNKKITNDKIKDFENSDTKVNPSTQSNGRTYSLPANNVAITAYVLIATTALAAAIFAALSLAGKLPHIRYINEIAAKLSVTQKVVVMVSGYLIFGTGYGLVCMAIASRSSNTKLLPK